MFSSDIAFRIFIQHWMKEENEAKKKKYFKGLEEKIYSAVNMKKTFLEFDLLVELWNNGDHSAKLRSRIYYFGMILAMFNGIKGVCFKCKKSVYRFEIYKTFNLIAICQNERCADVDLLFWDFFD